jgi:hypothetical protein
MTSQREQRRAQMAAAATRRTEPAARPAGQTAIRSKPVRITLDLSPELYRQLTRWVDEAAVELDVPRVALVDAVRAMIRVTTENPDEVLDRLRRDRERLHRPSRPGLAARSGGPAQPAQSMVRIRSGPGQGSALRSMACT